MDLVVFGIQGSGKGTQAKKLAAEFEYAIFEAGGELRRIAKEDSDLGRTVASYIDVGHLVPHEVIMGVVSQAIQRYPKDQRLLFDGVPRDADQQESFDRIMKDAGRAFRCVHLTADEHIVIDRILKRAKAEGRADDVNEEAVRRRMALFREKTLPVIEEYRRQGKLTDVDGEGEIEEVYGRIVDALEEKSS